MNPTIYVLDTSYLIEIADCARDSHPVAGKEVRRRFKATLRGGGRFFVPLPCLFELGDHIADVKHADRRTALVHWLQATVDECLNRKGPWLITPTQNPEQVLPALLRRFEPLAVKQSIGLVDAFAAAEAERLKANFGPLKSRVHIWTNDGRLKRIEPDQEADPYLWGGDGRPR